LEFSTFLIPHSDRFRILAVTDELSDQVVLVLAGPGDRAGDLSGLGVRAAWSSLRPDEGRRTVESEVQKAGERAALKADITRKEDVDRMFKEILDRFGASTSRTTPGSSATSLMLMADKDWTPS
jgi:NAD(P)-dependent dehydrogenase (short-subunit alcohol dehydrogenase family)